MRSGVAERITPSQAAAELARRHLMDFVVLTRPGYVPSWHHEEMAEALEAVERGEILRLMLFMPPQHGKSELGSVRFPAWYLGRNPKKHVAAGSYSSDLATDFGRQARNLVADPLYEEIFGRLISKDSTAADKWHTLAGGRYVSVGVGGPLTGRGADLLVIDDPFKDYEEAFSPVIREKVWNWYTTVALTRVRKRGAIILIETRWHEDDLAGRILKKAKETGEHWVIVSFQAISDVDEKYRKAGEALWPAGKPLSELLVVKATQGSAKWLSLYQQKPPKEQGVIFRREWFGTYKGDPFGERHRRSLILDSAHKTKKENDYSCLGTFDLMTSGIYLRHVWRDKCLYPDLKRKVQEVFAAWRGDELCIEDKDAGAMLIQELQRDTSLPVIALQADKDKVLRANAATPMCEAGRVFLPAEGTAAWLEDFWDELLGFPNATNDDQVDMFVHGINRLKSLGPFLTKLEDLLVDTGRRSIGLDLEPPL